MVSFLFLLTFLFIPLPILFLPLPTYPSTTPPLLLLPSLPALLSDLLLLLPSPLFAPGSREHGGGDEAFTPVFGEPRSRLTELGEGLTGTRP
jgi:hypothetical protein